MTSTTGFWALYDDMHMIIWILVCRSKLKWEKITHWFLNQCLSMTYSYIPWLSMTYSYIPWLSVSMTWFQNQVLSSAGLCISGILRLFRFSITRMNTDLPAQLSIQLNVFHQRALQVWSQVVKSHIIPWPDMTKFNICSKFAHPNLIIVIKMWCYPSVFRRKKRGLCVTVRRRPSVRQQFTSISSYTIDARITKSIWMIPLCIQMVATYLQFFYVFQFWNNSDISDFTQKMQILCEFLKEIG